MTNSKATKKALFMSMLSLLLCFTMLMGATFAWFTDTVKSTNNIIKSGNLDVELYYQVEGQTDWTKVDANSNIFNKNALWEPGYTEIVRLKAVNEGSLALKYQLGVNVVSEVTSTNVNGGEFKLSDHIKFGLVDGAADYTRDTAIAAVDAKATALATAYTSDVIELYPEGYVGEDTSKTYSDEKIVTLVVYMPTTVDNVANHAKDAAIPTINLGLNVNATQLAAEVDSFDKTYDENADFDGQISTYSALTAAIEKGGNFEVKADITIPEGKTITIPEGTTVTLNLGNKTITSAKHKSDGAVIENNGTLTITGGTISSTGDNGGSAIENNGTLTVNGSTLNGAPNANGSWPSYTVNNTGTMTINNAKVTSVHGAVASYGTGAELTLNNTDIAMSGIPGFTSHGIYTYNSGKVIVNGGNIANNATDQNSTGASVINGAVTVNAGTFSGRIQNYYGTPVIKGGTFDNNPSGYVADGYVAIEKDGKWSVVKGILVKNEAGLTSAITSGEESVYLATGNYTMPEPDLKGKKLTISGTKDTVIDVSAVDACDQFVTGATLEFDGVTLTFGKENYMGFANTASLTYKNCKINGLQFLFGENVTFENCEFNSNGAEHSVWTYGAKNVSFTGCDFTYGDRGINCYSDNDVAGGKQTVNFTNCEFTTTNTASAGAVEINSTYFSVGIEVNLTGCTAPACGELAYVSSWDSTNGAKTTINVK